MKKFTARIPEDLWEAARIRSIQERREFQEIVAAALAAYLKAKPGKGGHR